MNDAYGRSQLAPETIQRATAVLQFPGKYLQRTWIGAFSIR